MPTDPTPKLVLTRDLVASGVDPRRVQRAARARRLTKIRPGAYVELAAWQASRREERYRCLVLATVAAMRSTPVLSHESAAVLQGIPLIGGLPDAVQVVAPVASGGRSSKGIRRHGVGTMPPSVMVDGICVTSPARTAVDLARTRPFLSGLAAADYVLGAGLTTLEDIREQLALAGGGRGTRRARLVVDRADGRAESVGESLSRAQMYTLRLPIPDLQREFFDAEGFIGRVDFWWEELGLIGEFDGRTKYARGIGRREDRPDAAVTAEVLWAEKRREDRLRRVSRGVVRWVWDQALQPDELARVLGLAGIRPTA